MKNLDSYITEKLKVDDIVIPEGNFPIDGPIEKIVDFLNYRGFKDISVPNGLKSVFNRKKTAGYILDVRPNRIWFGDTTNGNISDDNRFFYYEEKHKFYGIYNDDHVVDVAKEEFLRELNKRFGWR